MSGIRSVCVFCGSSLPPDPRYCDAAVELGILVADRGLRLVFGGGQVGLMGALADAALDHGGSVTGVIPTDLFSKEVGHTGLTDLHEVQSMHERKTLMYDLADGFIALPGGLGTLEELAEVATWSQLGIHSKPIVFLNVDGFWNPLIEQLDRMVTVGLLKERNRGLIRQATSPRDALNVLMSGIITR